MAEKTGNLKLYLIAGLAAGGIYWVKDAVFYLTVTLLGAYLVAAARWHSRWVWMALGALAMVLLNCLLMWKVFDDPFHLITVSFNSLTRANTVAAILKRPPEFYFTYLLFDIKHVFLIFYLALGGIFLALRRHKLRQIAKAPEGFVALWAVGFLGLLSLLSLKQVNYILIFAAPMALLSAYFVSFWRRGVQLALLSLVVAICFVLAAFEQQAIHAFTANSRASVSFAEEHTEAAVFAATGAIRAQILGKTMGLSPEERSPIQSLTDLDVLLERQGKAGAGYGQQPSVSQEAFAIMDPQTAGWGDAGDSHWEQRLRSACLMKIGELRPALLGAGRYVVDGLMAAISLLPEPLASKFSSKLADSLRPKTAAIYRIGAPCAGSAS